MYRLIGIPAILILAACNVVEDVRLKNLETGEVVTCPGRAGHPSNLQGAIVAEQRGCIEDFKEQGYVRLPNSN